MESVNTEGCQAICAIDVGTSAEQVLGRQRPGRDNQAQRGNEETSHAGDGPQEERLG